MTYSAKIAGICLLFAISACRYPESAAVASDGTVVSGECVPMSGQTVVIGEVEVQFPTGEAVVILKDSMSCIGTVTFTDDRSISVLHHRGVLEFSFSEINFIVWQNAGERQSKTFEVFADSGWTTSGLTVSSGSIVSLYSGGTVMMKTGMSGPEGRDLSSTTIALVPRATNGELVMRVDSTMPVAVGATWTGTLDNSGELFFAVNIPRVDYPDENSGFYEVTVDILDGINNGSMVFYPEASWDVGHDSSVPNN